MRWKPNVTVAAMIEKDGKFLFVEEETRDGLRLNQPAGHLDDGESLYQAVIRETVEESGAVFVPHAVLGIYRMPEPSLDLTYLRVAFVGVLESIDAHAMLDRGIVGTVWLTPAELLAEKSRWRSALVGRCVQDYLRGVRYPLDILQDILSDVSEK
jgi:8-oxo-dGTP pyrophosphatase MutT (NUDIX family)